MTADLRYPVGTFDWAARVDPSRREPAIATLAALPARMREAIAGLNDRQFDTAYRPGGWTVRQVVHHVADSHANAFIRMKLGLTEDNPTIKPYDQDRWAALSDMQLPVEVSLGIIDGLHARWIAVCRQMAATDFARTFKHPEIGVVSLDTLVQGYAWHSRHHVAHITALRQHEGW
jgi:hypothetical protein